MHYLVQVLNITERMTFIRNLKGVHYFDRCESEWYMTEYMFSQKKVSLLNKIQ